MSSVRQTPRGRYELTIRSKLLPKPVYMTFDSQAEAEQRVLDDADLRASLSRQGKETVTARYDWQGIGQKLRSFVDAVQAGREHA